MKLLESFLRTERVEKSNEFVYDIMITMLEPH